MHKIKNLAGYMIALILSTIVIGLAMLALLYDEFKRRKIIWASAGDVQKKVTKKSHNLYLNYFSDLEIKNGNKEYVVGNNYIPVEIYGNSMRAVGILDENISIFNTKVNKSSYKKGDIVLIRMPEDDRINPKQYKLRIFDKFEGKKVFTKKYQYQSDNKNDVDFDTVKDQVYSSIQHNELNLKGRLEFTLSEKQQQKIYHKYDKSDKL